MKYDDSCSLCVMKREFITRKLFDEFSSWMNGTYVSQQVIVLECAFGPCANFLNELSSSFLKPSATAQVKFVIALINELPVFIEIMLCF